METLLEKEPPAGALGLAAGLEYDPGIYSQSAEVLRLAQLTAKAGGRCTSRTSGARTAGSSRHSTRPSRSGGETRMPVQIRTSSWR